MKLFTSTGVVIVPAAWIKALDPNSHRVQAHVVVYAANKADVIAVLVEGGLNERAAEGVARQLKLNTRGGGDSLRHLAEAGVIDSAQRSAVVYIEGHRSDAVIRVDQPGTPIVAHFRYREHRDADATGLPYGLYVEPVEYVKHIHSGTVYRVVSQDGDTVRMVDTEFGASTNYVSRAHIGEGKTYVPATVTEAAAK